MERDARWSQQEVAEGMGLAFLCPWKGTWLHRLPQVYTMSLGRPIEPTLPEDGLLPVHLSPVGSPHSLLLETFPRWDT